jgi:hypothetical protein
MGAADSVERKSMERRRPGRNALCNPELCTEALRERPSFSGSSAGGTGDRGSLKAYLDRRTVLISCPPLRLPGSP